MEKTDKIECPICLEQMQSVPYRFVCGHEVCVGCLILMRKTKIRTCPICKMVVEETPPDCPVCYEELNKWSLFVCGHAFCLDCIRKLKELNSTCPLCRRVVFFPTRTG